MKNYIIILVTISFFLLIKDASAQPVKADTIKKSTPTYEMKQYWFVMLVKGKNRDEKMDTATIINYRKAIWRTSPDWRN